MKLAMAQMRMSDDIQENFQKSISLLEDAARQGAELIFYPEIQLTRFFPQYPDQSPAALRMDSRYIRGFRDACRENHIFASPNFYIEENGRKYDMSLLIGSGGELLGRQKMVHIAQCPQFYEQSYYTPSEEGFAVFDTALGKIGIVVCFDRHYPESIRTEALLGADLILIPTANTAAEPSEMFRWEVKVQAFQNSVNVAMCNRVGAEDGMVFSGESILADYNGQTAALAGSEETLLLADCDLPGAARTRKEKPYTSLRRPELYQ